MLRMCDGCKDVLDTDQDGSSTIARNGVITWGFAMEHTLVSQKWGWEWNQGRLVTHHRASFIRHPRIT